VHATCGDDNFCTSARKCAGDAFANSASAAGDDGDIAFKAEEFTWCGVFLAHFLSILLGVD
jgi:hypothetical protein